MFLRMRFSTVHPRDTRGRWTDFQIQARSNIEEIDERFPVQIYFCRK
jgi:hypothetical protein